MKQLILFLIFILHVSLWAENPLIVAHRGASGEAPENTIPAFKLAWEQGADAIEGDFRLTKDGHIVCIHDKDTMHVAGKKLIVKDSTLAQLQQLDVGKHKGQQFAGTRIPTIAEVFTTIPNGKKIFIEVKSGPKIIPLLLKEIKDSKLTNDQVTIISFDPAVLLEAKRKSPLIKTSWLVSFRKNSEGILEPNLNAVLATLKVIKAEGFSSTKKYSTPKLINFIKNQGYEYHVWTINNNQVAQYFKKQKVKSITTDFPKEIRNTLFPKKQKSENNKSSLKSADLFGF